jgi:hypothetical protein
MVRFGVLKSNKYLYSIAYVVDGMGFECLSTTEDQ